MLMCCNGNNIIKTNKVNIGSMITGCYKNEAS